MSLLEENKSDTRLWLAVVLFAVCAAFIAMWVLYREGLIGLSVSPLIDQILSISLGAQVGQYEGEDMIVDMYQQYQSGELDPFSMLAEGGNAMSQGFGQMGTAIGTGANSVLDSLNLIWKGIMLFVGIIVVSIGGGITVTYGRHGSKQLALGIAGTSVAAWAVYGLYNAVKQGHIIPLIAIIVFLIYFNFFTDLGDVGLYGSMVFTVIIVLWIRYAPWFIWDTVRFSWDFFGPLATGFFDSM